jgi:hypothetical protein
LGSPQETEESNAGVSCHLYIVNSIHGFSTVPKWQAAAPDVNTTTSPPRTTEKVVVE